MRILVMLFVATLPATASAAQGRGTDEAELLRLHAELIAAHETNDVERWMAVEAAELVSANGGAVGFPDYRQRRQQRARYLAATVFHVYQDVRDPIVWRLIGNVSNRRPGGGAF